MIVLIFIANLVLLPAKEVKLAPVATALLKDGSTFVGQKSVRGERK